MIRRILQKTFTRYLTGYSNHERLQSRQTFSQFGEDLIIREMLESCGLGVIPGTYVDVGSYDPIYLSNTYALYRAGWSGLVVDANPEMVSRFGIWRERDRAINAFVSGGSGTIPFSVFDKDMFSTSTDTAHCLPASIREGERRFQVRTTTLSQLLDEAKIVDFQILNVDVEGADLEVLQSMDWERWQPKIVCCEDHSTDWASSETSQFLRELGYQLTSRCGYSSLFLLRN